MTSIQLSLWEIQQPLPSVCMVCGAKATLVKQKTFSWQPPGAISLLSMFPQAFVRRVHVNVPLCREHEHHWATRLVVVASGFLILAIAAVACATLGVGRLATWCWFGWAGALVIWFIATIILGVTTVRVTSITDRDVIFTSVSPEFVDAVLVQARTRDEARDYLGPYRLLPETAGERDAASMGFETQENIQEKTRDVSTPRIHHDANIQDKSRRSTPPDDRILE